MLYVFQHIIVRKLPLVLRGQWGTGVAPSVLRLPVALYLVDPEVVRVALRVRRVFHQLGKERKWEFLEGLFFRLGIGGNWRRIL